MARQVLEPSAVSRTQYNISIYLYAYMHKGRGLYMHVYIYIYTEIQGKRDREGDRERERERERERAILWPGTVKSSSKQSSKSYLRNSFGHQCGC